MRFLALTLVLLCAFAAQADDAAKLFDQLYGSKLKEVVRTATFADDISLAQELVSIANRYVENKPLFTLFCDKAYGPGFPKAEWV